MTVQRIRTTVEVLRGDGSSPSTRPPVAPDEDERPSVVAEYHPAEGREVLPPPPPTPSPLPPAPPRHDSSEVRLDLREGIDGNDVQALVEIDLARALSGGSVRLMVHTTEACPACRGESQDPECPVCRGTELAPRSRLVQLTVPPRLSDGRVLRVPGHGEPGLAGGRNGDLLITVRIKRHPRFRISGRDLVVSLPVPVPDAILGGPVPLAMPDGTLLYIHVQPGCQCGWRLRLRGLGLERDGGVGDLFADVVLALPARISPALCSLAEGMRRFYTEDEDPRPAVPARRTSERPPPLRRTSERPPPLPEGTDPQGDDWRLTVPDLRRSSERPLPPDWGGRRR